MTGAKENHLAAVSLSDASSQQVRPERSSPFNNLKAFLAWLNGLPLANVMAVSNELVAGLQDLNRSKVSGKLRVKMLDRLIDPIKTECALLDKDYQDTTFPLKEAVDRSGRVALQLFREMAVGYRVSTDELAGHSTSVAWMKRNAATRTIACALFCHEQYMFRLALLYQEMPVGVWSEIHSLFAFARQNDLQHKTEANPFDPKDGKSTIEDVYRRICVMGISNMCGLGQRSIRGLFSAAPIWAQRTRLVVGVPRSGLFNISLDEDQPPQLIDQPDGAGARLMLDVAALRDWLTPFLESADGRLVDIPFKRRDGVAVVMDNQALGRVVAAWGSRVTRSFQRLAADHEIKMIVGINGIHYRVAGEIGLSQFIDDLNDSNFFVSAHSDQNWITAADDRYRPIEYRAKVINQSVGGYRLHLTELTGMSLRVGEIVSVCASSIANRDTTWLLGLVRWIHAISTNEMEVGVVVIGHAVRSAVVLLDGELKGRTVPPFRGLIINGFSDENSEHLIVPGFFNQTDATVRMAYRDDSNHIVNRKVILTSLEDRTSEVSRFSFMDVDEDQHPQQQVGAAG